MAYPYRIYLTDDQRTALRRVIGTGIAPASMLTRARVPAAGDV